MFGQYVAGASTSLHWLLTILYELMLNPLHHDLPPPVGYVIKFSALQSIWIIHPIFLVHPPKLSFQGPYFVLEV